MLRMSFRTNATNKALLMRDRGIIANQNLEAAAQKAGKFVYQLARRYSSARDHSLADLRKLGHPYSTRFGRDHGPHPDWLIHRQTSDLYNSWSWQVVSITARGVTVKVWNTSGHAKYMLGTHRMRVRPILQKVQEDLRQKIWRGTMDAIRDAIRRKRTAA